MTAATVAVHVVFAAGFAALLTWRESPPPDADAAIPVEVVTEIPKSAPPKAAAPASPPAPKPAEPPKPALQAIPQPPAAPALQAIPQSPPAPAPDPNPPAPPAVVPPSAGSQGPALRAPPPEPARAASQTEKNDPANTVPDSPAPARAIREAKPAEAPRALVTADPSASFAVPPPAPPKTDATPPAPAAPRAPNETEKLAAVLPMDTSAMPASFRAVLSGNGAAVNTAYKGLVYGRFSHMAEINERAYRQHLKGQVIVAFTIDDAGAITSLAVLQSSGNAAVDALGMELIRSAAPFPPPPPGAQRSFTPAFGFGE